jgi:Pyruvate/2-oxoacid:ferredoxin oxidoreductase delta subunit
MGTVKPCQIAHFSCSGHSTPMAGGSAAASVGSAVIFAPTVASRAHRHCTAVWLPCPSRVSSVYSRSPRWLIQATFASRCAGCMAREAVRATTVFLVRSLELLPCFWYGPCSSHFLFKFDGSLTAESSARTIAQQDLTGLWNKSVGRYCEFVYLHISKSGQAVWEDARSWQCRARTAS